MRPVFTVADQANHAIADGDKPADFHVGKIGGFAKFPDLQNLLFSQFGAAMTLTLYPTVLAFLVVHIVGLVAEEKMIWPNAAWSIAMMKDVKPVSDRAVGELPRNTMGFPPFLFDEEVPVSTPILNACPEPAGIRLVDLGPEAILHVECRGCHAFTCEAAEATLAFVNTPSASMEGFPANFAGAFDLDRIVLHSQTPCVRLC